MCAKQCNSITHQWDDYCAPMFAKWICSTCFERGSRVEDPFGKTVHTATNLKVREFASFAKKRLFPDFTSIYLFYVCPPAPIPTPIVSAQNKLSEQLTWVCLKFLPRIDKTSHRFAEQQWSPKCLVRGYISYNTTARRLDILRNEIVSGYDTLFHQVSKFFVNIWFVITDKMSSRTGWNGVVGRIWPERRSLETPAVKHWCAYLSLWPPNLNSNLYAQHFI